ncbi:universal stress protein [Xanthovirga aplysinae]|uniref:universal stress protein n=1 Tax=Xanthovirga aplysinae TaxID=2529853 RepID=UPI0012BC7AC2|nr:universal stress protein [Xanthovirga aplysinae]MTI31482.1 universal stress protein [Xanthovirga aplysinae]
MYRMNKILIPLDLTEMDDVLIRYSAMIARMMKSEEVYFMHIAKNLEVPEPILEKFPKLNTPVDENLAQELDLHIHRLIGKDISFDIKIEVKEGDPAEQILHWSRIKDIDLIIVGRKDSQKGAGILMQKLTKKANSSVMVVPEGASFSISKILTPVDFSKHSTMALEQSIEIAKNTGAAIVCQNIYMVPWGYHSTGKSFEEFAAIMKGHAENHMQKFLKPFDLDGLKVHKLYTLDEENDPSVKIFQISEKLGIDLAVLGSKGRTNAAAILLGSVAEKVTVREYKTPVLIVKKKGETLGFLEALLNL